MLDPICTPLPTSTTDAENHPDHLGDLLACLSELLVDTAQVNARLTAAGDGGDLRAHEAIARFGDVQRRLYDLSCEAAAVHQQLQHVHLV